MKINVENLKEFSFIHGVVKDSELLNKWKKEILIETYPLDTTGTSFISNEFIFIFKEVMYGMPPIDCFILWRKCGHPCLVF